MCVNVASVKCLEVRMFELALIFCFPVLIQISSPLLWPFEKNTN